MARSQKVSPTARIIALLDAAKPLTSVPGFAGLYILPNGKTLNGYHLRSLKDYLRRRLSVCGRCEDSRPAPHMDICEQCEADIQDERYADERAYWNHIDNQITAAKERRLFGEDA